MALYRQSIANIIIHICALCQLGVAAAIIIIVRQNLWWYVNCIPRRFYYCSGDGWGDECLLSKPGTSVNLCSYSYWVVGFSFFLSIALMFAQCFIRARKSYLLATLGLTLVGTIWWLGFAITATAYGVDANDAGVPSQGERNATWILGWVNSLLFLGSLLTSALVMGGCMRLLPPPAPVRPYAAGPVHYQPGPGGYPPGSGYGGVGYGVAPPNYTVPGYPVSSGAGYPPGCAPTYPPPAPYPQGGYPQATAPSTAPNGHPQQFATGS